MRHKKTKMTLGFAAVFWVLERINISTVIPGFPKCADSTSFPIADDKQSFSLSAGLWEFPSSCCDPDKGFAFLSSSWPGALHSFGCFWRCSWCFMSPEDLIWESAETCLSSMCIAGASSWLLGNSSERLTNSSKISKATIPANETLIKQEQLAPKDRTAVRTQIVPTLFWIFL